MALKRSASEARLLSRPSPFSTSVTLFEAGEASTSTEPYGVDSPRRSKRVKKVIKTEAIEEVEDVLPVRASPPIDHVSSGIEPDSSESPKKSRVIKAPIDPTSPKKNKPVRMILDKPHPAPPKWEEVYNAIKEMRKKYIAPVDTMGCDQAQLREIEPKVFPYAFTIEHINNLVI